VQKGLATEYVFSDSHLITHNGCLAVWLLACIHCPGQCVSDGVVLIPDIGLDPGFKNFYDWCKANNIPFVIVSSGMEPTIRAVLETLLPIEDAQSIDIISNDVKFTDAEGKGEKWEIVYRHPDSGFGHDKSKAILPYRDLPHKPTLFFCGDGVSGMSGFLSYLSHADTPTSGKGLLRATLMGRLVCCCSCRCLICERDGQRRFRLDAILQA
jgi:2,3-diketo-5-methylthio-1-phosphopentane phosphatase